MFPHLHCYPLRSRIILSFTTIPYDHYLRSIRKSTTFFHFLCFQSPSSHSSFYSVFSSSSYLSLSLVFLCVCISVVMPLCMSPSLSPFSSSSNTSSPSLLSVFFDLISCKETIVISAY